MADKAVPRNVTPIIQILRNFLLGRKHTPEGSALRYAKLLSARDQPQPILPGGEAHKLADNYYYARDGRREVAPPRLIKEGVTRKQITAGTSGPKAVATYKKAVTPGNLYEWDSRN